MVLRPTKRRMNPGFAYLFAYSSSFVAEIKEERRGLLVEFASLFEHSREEKSCVLSRLMLRSSRRYIHYYM